MTAIPWFILILLTLIWYILITFIVAIRGAQNIKQLLEEGESGRDV